MSYLNLNTASQWDIDTFLESERQASIDRYTDDCEPEEEEDWE